MRQSVKERDMAGMAAFELALQYLMVRQDRSFHFVQLVTVVLTLVFFTELTIALWLMVILPVVPYLPVEPFAFLHSFNSPLIAVLSLIALLLTRASKTRFVIEPGEQTLERLNKDVLEPCLGVKFDTETGKLYTDRRNEEECELETFYSMRYVSEGGASAHAAGHAGSDNAADGSRRRGTRGDSGKEDSSDP